LFLATEKFLVRSENNGEEVVVIASHGAGGGDAYKVDSDNETAPCPKNYRQLREDEMGEKVWRHTIVAFEEIEVGRVFYC
jgi:hypothetical protein